jgi:hypothetical protein
MVTEFTTAYGKKKDTITLARVVFVKIKFDWSKFKKQCEERETTFLKIFFL